MDTIKQRMIVVDLGDRKVEVRRLRWKAARDLVAALARHMAKARPMLADISAARNAKAAAPADPEAAAPAPGIGAAIEKLVEQLPEMIGSVGELIDKLVVGSTDLNVEQVAELDTLELGLVLEAARQLNLGDELKNCWAGIARGLAGLVVGDGTPTTTGDESTPS